MVGGHEKHVTLLLARLINLSNLFICGRYSFYGSLVDTCMPYHIGRGKVVHQEFELLLASPLAELVCNACGTHWRVQIVSSNFWTGDQLSLFASELLLHTAVEEKGDVCVFLGLSNVTLFDVLLAEPFRQNVAHVLWWKG